MDHKISLVYSEKPQTLTTVDFIQDKQINNE